MDVLEVREVVQFSVISSCSCPRNSHGKAGNEERRRRKTGSYFNLKAKTPAALKSNVVYKFSY